MPVGGNAPLTVFVYFRAATDARERVPAALARHFALVRERVGVTGRHGLRHELHGDRHCDTWLEVYPEVSAGDLRRVLDAIDRASTDSGLALLASEDRHVEAFALGAS